MNLMDWIFAGVIALLAVRCFVRGFVSEVLSVAAWAVGLMAALLFYNQASGLLVSLGGLGSMAPAIRLIIAFVLCFIAGFLVMKLIERLVRGGLEAANLEMLDRILGLALGVAEGLAVVAFALVVLEVQGFFDVKELLGSSWFAKTILPIVGPAVDQAIGPAVRDLGTKMPGKVLPAIKAPTIPAPGK